MSGDDVAFWLPRAVAALGAAAILSAVLIVVLHPLLERYALARPNVRSSHTIPTPQGGGIAVITATIVVTYVALHFLPAGATHGLRLPIIAAAVILIGCVGVLADLHPDNVATRLLAQTLAVAAVIFALPPDLRAIPLLPWWVERAVLVVGGLWFVNLVNFMDGLDLMAVGGVVPMTAALAMIGILGVLPPPATVAALALCGAMIGFAWFNRPVAKLFLGDVGSLPIGLLLGWLLLLASGHGGRAAAILLPLYFIADTTVTLIRRGLNGEPVWQAHRTHVYQRATDRGLSASAVVLRAFLVNVLLAALAVATVVKPSRELDVAALIAGSVLVGSLFVGFARGFK
jgi:UDP-N-acetylmuramyl pentapeptide phosphotransferase/UDP-N-acetylglucosamine-1-phosphate transferase